MVHHAASVTFGAFGGAENLVFLRMAKKLLSNQRPSTHATLKACVIGMPELALVFDPLCVCIDDFMAIKALLGIQPVVALHAMRVAITSHIQETAQIQIALVTTEVLTVPVTILGLSVLTAKDQLKKRNTLLLVCRVDYAVFIISNKDKVELEGRKELYMHSSIFFLGNFMYQKTAKKFDCINDLKVWKNEMPRGKKLKFCSVAETSMSCTMLHGQNYRHPV